MKKKEILKLLEYRKNKLEIDYGKSINSSITDELGCPNKGIYPDIKELAEEFAIIDKEFEKLREKRKKSKLYLENNKDEVDKIKCNHPVIFGYRHTFGYSYYCAFCNKEVREKDNRVCLLSSGDDDDYEEDEILSRKEELELFNRFYAAITVMLKDLDDDDEVDFTRRFSKDFEVYSIGNVEINIPIKEYNILVISGSNRIKLSDNIYLNKEVKFDERIIDHFEKLGKCKIYQVTSLKNINKGYDTYYQTMDELNESLIKLARWNMDVVIDYSDLIDYEIVNNEVKLSKVSLDLKTMFPNSVVIPIQSIRDEISLYRQLRDILSGNKEKGFQKKYEFNR